DVGLALRESEERETRLWVEPQAVRAGERILGARQITGPSHDLPALVQRPPGGGGIGDGVLAHAPGLSLGIAPSTAERRDLGPGHAASSRIGALPRECLAPGRGGAAPFACAPEIRDVEAGIEDAE